jgi:hypothetical protein
LQVRLQQSYLYTKWSLGAMHRQYVQGQRPLHLSLTLLWTQRRRSACVTALEVVKFPADPKKSEKLTLSLSQRCCSERGFK